jgi:type IX secretion system PorP/SprF family membrane protein
MKFHLSFFLFVIIISINITYGQDPTFSNIYKNYIYFNPGAAGIDGGWNINLTYRTQWPNIPGRFETYYLEVDRSICTIPGAGGIGLMAFSDTEGEGLLRKITVGVPFSVRIRMTENSYFLCGFYPSYNLLQIDFEKLTFSDQLDPYYGKIHPTSYTPTDDLLKRGYMDWANFGVIYRMESKQQGSNSERYHRKLDIGLSFFHINNPNLSISGLDSPLPCKIVFFSNYLFPVYEKSNHYKIIMLHPGILLEKQYKFFSYTAGCNSNFVNNEHSFTLGLWYRNKGVNLMNTDALIILAGYRKILKGNEKSYIDINFTYDLCSSSLGYETYGSYELTVSWFWGVCDLFKNRKTVCDKEARKMARKQKTLDK